MQDSGKYKALRTMYVAKVTNGLSLPPHFPHIAPGGGEGGWGISSVSALCVLNRCSEMVTLLL